MFTKIYIGSDHAGYKYKNLLKDYLEEKGVKVIDLGSFTVDAIDYPDIAREVCEKVVENDDVAGILVCGTGTGMNMAANRFNGIRAVYGASDEVVEMGRIHNNANVLTIGERVLDLEHAKKMSDIFLNTEFDGDERHARRVNKMG